MVHRIFVIGNARGTGPPTLNLAITVQDRTLFAGPVALARLPAIRWKERQPAR